MERIERTGELSMREAAEWLGFGNSRAAGRVLRRKLEKRERELGRPLILRYGGSTGHRVTKATLRDVFPQHFSQREKVVGMMRDQLQAIERRITEVGRESRNRDRALGSRLRRVESCLGTQTSFQFEPATGP